MSLLPINNFTFKTKLKEDEIIKRLSKLIKPEGIYFFSTNKYAGEIRGQTFDIHRNVSTYDGLIPEINGVIKNDFDGTAIIVKMKLKIQIEVFLYILGIILGFVFFVNTTQALIDWKLNVWAVVSFVMLLLAYIWSVIGFIIERNKSIDDLASLFEADIIDD